MKYLPNTPHRIFLLLSFALLLPLGGLQAGNSSDIESIISRYNLEPDAHFDYEAPKSGNAVSRFFRALLGTDSRSEYTLYNNNAETYPVSRITSRSGSGHDGFSLDNSLQLPAPAVKLRNSGSGYSQQSSPQQAYSVLPMSASRSTASTSGMSGGMSGFSSSSGGNGNSTSGSSYQGIGTTSLFPKRAAAPPLYRAIDDGGNGEDGFDGIDDDLDDEQTNVNDGLIGGVSPLFLLAALYAFLWHRRERKQKKKAASSKLSEEE